MVNMDFEMEFPQSVIIEPFAEKDVDGNVTYGTPVTSDACVDYLIKNIKDFRGNELITSAWIALPPTASIAYNSRVTLPDGSKPYIGSIGEAYDYESKTVIYKEVYVGRVKPGEGIL
jgi:hypothetical protein